MSISQVLPHLYVSDCVSARSKSFLVEHNIKRIVSVTHRDYDLPDNELCDELGISTKVFAIADAAFNDKENALVKEFFPWVNDAEDAGQAVLVHCQQGLSRSTSFIVAYLAWKGMDAGDAIRFVQKRHPDMRPWLDTMESFLGCIGGCVPEEHKDRSGERERVK